MTYEQVLGGREKEKLSFNRKKPLTEPGSGQPSAETGVGVGVEGRSV